MENEFHPHKFHPTRFAEDPYDLLIYKTDKAYEHTGFCKCENGAHNHPGGKCGAEVTRSGPPAEQGYVCYDCKRLTRSEREKNYRRKNGKPLRHE